MVAGVGTAQRLIDLFYSTGVGVICALLYALMRTAAGSRRGALFFCDLAGFLLAAGAIFSFGVSFSYTGCLRWYMVLGEGLGFLGGALTVVPKAAKLGGALHWLLGLPFVLLKRFVFAPVGRFFAKKRQQRALKRKNSQKEEKQSSETLPKERKVLYNS